MPAIMIFLGVGWLPLGLKSVYERSHSSYTSRKLISLPALSKKLW